MVERARRDNGRWKQPQAVGSNGGVSSASSRRRRQVTEKVPPQPAVDCRKCELRGELAHLVAVNARLRTDMAELLDFLEEISGLLMPAMPGGGEEPLA